MKFNEVEKECWIIITEKQVWQSYESRWGDQGSYESYHNVSFFTNKSTWESQVDRMQRSGEKFKAGKFNPATITTTISIEA